MRVSTDPLFFDPNQGTASMALYWAWMEGLFKPDRTVDPSVQNFLLSYVASEYTTGNLLKSWEFTVPATLVLHLRQGIRWQDIAPANGREFVADDIVFHFNRMAGLGNGYTAPNAYFATDLWLKYLTAVTATDKYTVAMKFSAANPEFILQNMQAPGCDCTIENPEAVKQWTDLSDWHHAIGTGPFILKDFISGSSSSMVKNPNYWGYDERYPQNKLPYVDRMNCLIIPDNATALAGVRTGKIDLMDTISLTDSQAVKKTNPEILQIPVPLGNGLTLDPRNDKAPFNDVRVRQALQMSLNLAEIAQNYYAGSADPSPLPLTSNYLKGWGFPYSQWPQSLKDEYAYNPTGAKQLLAAAGFPTGFKTNVAADNIADLDLLQVVQSYFAKIGVDMTINAMTHTSFTAFVTSGHKNDALAYRTTGSLGVTFYPIRQLTKFFTASSQNVCMVSDPAVDAFYNNALAATTSDEVKNLVLEANKYVVQHHFAISLLQPTIFYVGQPWLKGFSGQYGATAGGNGPFYAYEYEASFWVDQNIKKSMGH
jgi:ABC-type transport system substrate-binding protein